MACDNRYRISIMIGYTHAKGMPEDGGRARSTVTLSCSDGHVRIVGGGGRLTTKAQKAKSKLKIQY